MRPPIFSIITITHNNIEGLKRTAASVAAQTGKDFEWLVVDGASTDGTPEYLQSINAAFSSEPDNGLYDAMNKGIDHAQGEHLIFMNAGDEFAGPDVLECLEDLIQDNHPDFIYGDALETRKSAPPVYKPARPHTKADYGLFTHHQSMLYRREAIGDLRYDLSHPIAADYKFTLQALGKSANVLYVPLPLSLYEAGGLSQQQAAKGRDEQMDIRRELGFVPEWENRLIAFKQTLAWNFRARFPNLYWSLKNCLRISA